jgi:hypothetical protein
MMSSALEGYRCREENDAAKAGQYLHKLICDGLIKVFRNFKADDQIELPVWDEWLRQVVRAEA